MFQNFLPLIILGGLGIILFLIGIIVFNSNKNARKSASAETLGKVIKYCYPGNQSIGPVAEYYVEGKKYKAKKKYRYFSKNVKRTKLSDFNPDNASLYVDENDVFHAVSGGIINYKTFGENTWPIGSEIKVFYNPENPKKAYLERVPKKGSIVAPVFIFVGLGIFALGLLLTVLFVKFHVCG